MLPGIWSSAFRATCLPFAFSWLPLLPQSFTKHGIEVVATDRRREHPYQRQMLLENFVHVANDKAAMRVKRGMKPQEYQTEIEQAIQRTLEASRQGAYFAITAQVVVGRVPE